MVWGIRDNKLVLVKKGNIKEKLVFDKLKPSFTYDPNDLSSNSLKTKVFPLAMKNFEGKGIRYSGKINQYDHGMDQLLEVCDENEAMKVYHDKDGHIHDADKPY